MGTWENIDVIAKKVRNKKLSPLELVNKAINNAKQAKEFNAIISLQEDVAMQKAKKIDEKIQNKKDIGRLAGVPFIVKDNFMTFGSETTAASNILKGYHAPYQSTAVERLESEGAILIGKANLDAFACGSSTENSDFGVVKNPHNPEYVAGGSSGGSAAVVALDVVPFSLGTDTGGSIRLPASFCGVVGYKPTYGLVSRFGVIALASSLDVVGPITSSVEDTQLILDVIAGKDGKDSTAVDREKSYITDEESLKGKRVGVIKQFMEHGLDGEVRNLVENKINKITQSGAVVEEVSLPILDEALACYYIIMPAELSSNLARYDGIRYGHSSSSAKSINETYIKTRNEGFSSELKRRIMLGTFVLSSGYYDAYYKKAQLVRSKLIADFEKTLSKYDVLIGPTASTTAFKIGKNINNPLQMYLMDIITVAANLAGVPAISIPIGMSVNMPVGMQIISKQKEDKKLLGIAREMEKL
ncbi:Asp-tRNA(Asn)/Glu-tRNA(Gln) amidotransferase subunit GatA [Candidatus Saccharibacteria bacterium CPR2]|nr:Asp-tRNA(Asn)/Glu-tRNA(Gln) amidotransferase subunit GatA [Candidatus Saccharibacteria bacterium CPR2]